MKKTLVLLDFNNLGFMSMNYSDPISSFLARIVTIKNKFPNAELMFLQDGRSWRKDIYPEYKANRTVTEKQVQAREEYFEAKKLMIECVRLLGLAQVTTANYEADDLAGIMSAKWGGKVILVSRDGDWLQLVKGNVQVFDPYNETITCVRNFTNLTKYRDPEQFIEAKCILGDAGDNVKGLKGVGPKAIEGVYYGYPLFSDFLDAMEKDRERHIARWFKVHGKIMPKALREIDVDAARQKISENMALVDLGTAVRPKPIDLKIDRPLLNREEFLKFSVRNLPRIAREFDDFIKLFEENNVR